MSYRFLPGVVFLVCVLIGFGVGLEADGQSTDQPDWTQPEWDLPWGMTWPVPEPVPEPVMADAMGSSDVLGDDAVALTDVAGPTGSEPTGPGVFPGLVNLPAEAPGEAPSEDVAASDGEENVASTLNAQLTQLEALEEQLRTMTEATQVARAAMESALEGIPSEPEEPVEPATPAQIEASLVLLTDMVKKMKASDAATLLQEWDDKLAIVILRRLGSRRATPIISKMPAAVSGRLTSQIAAGVGALLPVNAEGPDAPPQGEVK